MEASEKSKVSGKDGKSKTSYKVFMKEIFDGSILTKGFFVRNFKLILIIVAGLLFYIGNHYSVIMDLDELDSLKKELADVKYEALTESSKLMRESRQSNIREMVQQKGLGLEDSNVPPYLITVEE